MADLGFISDVPITQIQYLPDTHRSIHLNRDAALRNILQERWSQTYFEKGFSPIYVDKYVHKSDCRRRQPFIFTLFS